MITRLEENLVYENRYIRIFDDPVRFPSGTEGTYVRIASAHEGRGVVLVAIFDDKVALVRTYRYALGRDQWALPRGFAHGPAGVETACAELREEVGAVAETVVFLGSLTPDSGLLTHEVDVYQMNIDQAPTSPEDTDEVLALKWLTESEVSHQIRVHEIDDGFTIAAWCLYLLSK